MGPNLRIPVIVCLALCWHILFAQVPDATGVPREGGSATEPFRPGGAVTLLIDTAGTGSAVIEQPDTDTRQNLHPLIWEHVTQEKAISYLLYAHRDAVRKQRGIAGYRVHLYMDSGNRARLNTQRAQADFEKKYPEYRSYIVYEEPYFKLRAGDFRTRLEARRFLEKIRKDYSAAYIVVDRIRFPELD